MRFDNVKHLNKTCLVSGVKILAPVRSLCSMTITQPKTFNHNVKTLLQKVSEEKILFETLFLYVNVSSFRTQSLLLQSDLQRKRRLSPADSSEEVLLAESGPEHTYLSFTANTKPSPRGLLQTSLIFREHPASRL